MNGSAINTDDTATFYVKNKITFFYVCLHGKGKIAVIKTVMNI